MSDLAHGVGSQRRGLWKDARRRGSPGIAPPAPPERDRPRRRRLGHPGADGKPAPLIAAMDAGRPHARDRHRLDLALAFFRAARRRRAERAYHRFWSNALRWLVRDPEHSRIRVLPDRRRFEVDEPIDVTVMVRGRDYQAVANAHVRLRLDNAEGGVVKLDDLTTGDGGLLRQRYTGLAPGAYRAHRRSQGWRRGPGPGHRRLRGREPGARAHPRRAATGLLEAIADVTHGKVCLFSAESFGQLKVIDPGGHRGRSPAQHRALGQPLGPGRGAHPARRRVGAAPKQRLSVAPGEETFGSGVVPDGPTHRRMSMKKNGSLLPLLFSSPFCSSAPWLAPSGQKTRRKRATS